MWLYYICLSWLIAVSAWLSLKLSIALSWPDSDFAAYVSVCLSLPWLSMVGGGLYHALVGGRHVHTLWLIFVRSFSHPSGSLARVFLIADPSILDGNRFPHWGQPSGLSTPTRVDLRGGPPDRLEPACGSNSSSPAINSYNIVGLILLCSYLASLFRTWQHRRLRAGTSDYRKLSHQSVPRKFDTRGDSPHNAVYAHLTGGISETCEAARSISL
jgi:hypothetical protein